MGKTKVVLIGILAMLLVLMPLLGACAKEKIVEVPVEKVVEKEVVKEVPVEKVVEKEVVKEVPAKELDVKVGVILDTTSVLGVQGRKMLATWRCYEKYIDEEKGGWRDKDGNIVNLRILWGDTGFKPDKSIALYKKFKAEGMVAFYNVGSVELAAVREMAISDWLPTASNSVSMRYPLPSPVWSHFPNYCGQTMAAIDYIAEKWEKSDSPWTKERKPRLAFIGPEGYPSWEASITPEVCRYAKLQGVDVVASLYIPLRPIDTKPQVLAAKDAGADFIYTGVVVPQGGAVIRDWYNLGLKGDPTKEEGKIEVIGQAPVTVHDTAKLAGKEAVEGLIMEIGMPPNPNVIDTPAGREQLRLMGKYGFMPVEEVDTNNSCAWTLAILTGEAIKLALQEVPADKLTGRDVWEKGFVRIKDFDTGGMCPNKVTLSEEERIASKGVYLYEARDGEQVKIGSTRYIDLEPRYTEEYAKAHGKKSIYTDEALKVLGLTAEEVGYKRIK